MMKPSAVSFSATTHWLMIAGSIDRTACGSEDQPHHLRLAHARSRSRPRSAREAPTGCRRGRSPPARSRCRASAPSTRAQKVPSGRRNRGRGRRSAAAAGTARKNSTTTTLGQRTAAWSDSRPDGEERTEGDGEGDGDRGRGERVDAGPRREARRCCGSLNGSHCSGVICSLSPQHPRAPDPGQGGQCQAGDDRLDAVAAHAPAARGRRRAPCAHRPTATRRSSSCAPCRR